ncbi:MAG: hypothetical protein ACD_76C00069G0001 [uncultured bacterium]|nr:MAG: hypothetical protein ACD_76C00069G0001 [uncultured bacterium]HBD05119.1 ribose-5-phosphate isomerase [Candidatus Uhrbacteria bacterium]
MKTTAIIFGADHAGYKLKQFLARELEKSGNYVIDLGNEKFNKSDDYPIFAHAVATAVSKTKNVFGILLCGNAVGMCMTANKVKGVRAGIGYSEYASRTMRTDDDANVLCIPARALTNKKALSVTNTFLNTKFSNAARHKRRLKQVKKLESITMK